MPQSRASNRNPDGTFPKGASGNPGGRPKGFALGIRQATKEGQELIDFMLRVFRGTEAGAEIEHQVMAATWLADRGFGKPVQSVHHAGGLTVLSDLSDAELEDAIALAAPRRHPTPPEQGHGTNGHC